ncbi:uracil-DNA glycosylase [Helicobacter baculiformis]|uniref:Uracil-DNA glycosylase n=1 Tax=Helicobacter baculiformis TaxID=427351 RepID=A0ABV7ZGU0_9HELI|nr:uracil-DNA glycosylase [Helicobacter baculiformis]
MLFHALERVPHAWGALLKPIIQSPHFEALNKNYMQALTDAQKRHTRVFPFPSALFKAFEATPLERLHTILLGQDPYHSTFIECSQEYPLAMGLSFSVPNRAPIPQSLRNIYQELHQSLHIPKPTHGNLESWAQQGVLLLNAILSVEKNKAKSHGHLGWEHFTNSVLIQLSTLERPLVFIFLGRVAQEKIKLLTPNTQHLILSAPHPSPLAQHRAPFFLGSGVFLRAQEFLEEKGIPMQWALQNAVKKP